MKIPRFSNAIGNLDEDLVEAAAECKKKTKSFAQIGFNSSLLCRDHCCRRACSSIAFRRRTYTRRHKR